MLQTKEFPAWRSVDSKLVDGHKWSDITNGLMGTRPQCRILVVPSDYLSKCATSVQDCGADLAKVLQDSLPLDRCGLACLLWIDAAE